MNGYSVEELIELIEKKYEKETNYKLLDDRFDEKINEEFPNLDNKRYILTNYYDEEVDKVYRVAVYKITDVNNDSIFTVEYRQEI